MMASDLVRPARSWRLLLALALLVALIAIALVATHALLGAPAPAHTLSSIIHKPVCGGTAAPC